MNEATSLVSDVALPILRHLREALWIKGRHLFGGVVPKRELCVL